MSYWIRDYHVEYGCQIDTKSGTIGGKTFCFKDGRKVNAFMGIPYAKNGSHGDRFKRAKPLEPWKGILDCTDFGPRAIQADMIWDKYITPVRQSEEDCLNMNIFVPAWESSQFPHGRPVMVFVHGGGFLIHSAANYGDWNICKNICYHDVIVCVIQYRLGLLGFLSTGDDSCPGNFGLWDQLDAFRWIHQNIKGFGGDPDNVTAFGQSAGAASVDLLSLSPYSKGLFQRIILMGGNASSDWAMATPQRTLNAALALARKLGWRGDKCDHVSLLNFFRDQPAHVLTTSLVGKSAFNRDKNGLEFCPVIDGDLLPFPVDELRKRAPKITLHIPPSLQNFEKLRRKAKRLYVDSIHTNDRHEVARAFLKLYSDLLMNNCTQKYCQDMVMAGHTVYLYNMTYFNVDSFGFFAFRMPFLAATHCHDLRYLFGKGLYSKFRPNYDDLCMLDIVATLWTNFAKFQDPNGSEESKIIWYPISESDTYKHLNIDLEPQMMSDYQGRRAEFWLDNLGKALQLHKDDDETSSQDSTFSVLKDSENIRNDMKHPENTVLREHPELI
ncbi:carboxylesterase family domain-containing protein [Ditylenchus destructor]|uniref:Carboxylesterase family domain-containing protein n=1 Tax=Ditylenchus destructor TaxID=166010 RepID=A0AAD4RCJ8_9BILA|nr:carboxylesterase family domain-containing protein [Ditylenchus destructor]